MLFTHMSQGNPARMKIAVVGAGAVGSVIGGILTEGGANVVLVDIWKEHVDAINEKGLLMTGYGEERTIKVRATSNFKEVGVVDLVILMTKACQTEQAIRDALPLVGENTTVLTLQNGLGNEEIIGKAVGNKKVMGGCTISGGDLLSPGKVREVAGLTYIGELNRGVSERGKRISKVFNEAGFKTTLSENILVDIWRKLLFNVAVNPTAALCRLFCNEEMFEIKEVKEMMFDAIDEAGQVARLEGIEVDPKEVKETLVNTLREQGPTGSGKSGMLVDVEHERKTEIDFINGAIVRLGKKHGIRTPVNKTLVAAVKGLERNFKE